MQILLFILILLLPVTSEATYKIYLKNGSTMSGVSSYEKQDGEVVIYFGGGSLGISEKDILKIEETETDEKDFRTKESPVKEGEPPPPPAPSAPPSEATADKSARVNSIKAELESVNSEIMATEEEEARAKQAIDERTKRKSYNYFQLKKLERDLEPLQQELFAIQQRKSELVQRKSSLEGELRALE